MYGVKIHDKPQNEGLQEFFNTLVKENWGWVLRAARSACHNIFFPSGKVFKKDYDLDDYVQSGLTYAWMDYGRYTAEKKDNPAIIPPGKWLYIQVKWGAVLHYKYNNRMGRNMFKSFTEEELTFLDSREDEMYDFEQSEQLPKVIEKVYDLPERERRMAIAFLNNEGDLNSAIRAIDKSATYLLKTDFQSAIELIKLKLLFSEETDRLYAVKNLSLAAAASFAIDNSKTSLSVYRALEDGKTRIECYNDFIGRLQTLLSYCSLDKKRTIDLTEADYNLVKEKLKLSGSGAGDLTRLRFVLTKLVNMNVIPVNPLPFNKDAYYRQKLRSIAKHTTVAGKKSKSFVNESTLPVSMRIINPVAQYDLTGKFIGYYESMLAVEKAGFERNMVWRCCRGLQEMTGGFKWRDADEEEVRKHFSENNKYTKYVFTPDVSPMVDVKRCAVRDVYQFDFNGNIITKYSSFQQAQQLNPAMKVKVIRSAITTGKSAYGYLWGYTHRVDPSFLNRPRRTDSENKRIETPQAIKKPRVLPAALAAMNEQRVKPVYQFDFSGNLITRFKSLGEATDFGFDSNGLRQAVRNKRACAGYLWSYENKLREDHISRYSSKLKAV